VLSCFPSNFLSGALIGADINATKNDYLQRHYLPFFVQFQCCLPCTSSQSIKDGISIHFSEIEGARGDSRCCLVFVSSRLFVQVIIALSPSRQFWLWICRYQNLRICSAQQSLSVLYTLSLHLHPCRNFPLFFTLTPPRLRTRPRRLRRKLSLPFTHYLHLFFSFISSTAFMLFSSVFCAVSLPLSTHIQTYTYAIQYIHLAAWLGSFFGLICDRLTADVSSILLFPFSSARVNHLLVHFSVHPIVPPPSITFRFVAFHVNIPRRISPLII